MQKKISADYIRKYWWTVIRDSFIDVFKKSVMNNIEKIALSVLVLLTLVFFGITTIGALSKQFSLTNLFTTIALFFASVLVAIYHKPPELQAEAEEKITLLNKNFDELKYQLDLREYNDLDLEFFDYPFSDHQIDMIGRGYKNFLKIGLLVTNRGGVKINCSFRIMSIKYNGHGYPPMPQRPNEWIDDIEPFEIKRIKWDEGINTPDGMLEIAPKGGVGRMLFAEIDNQNICYHFWYVDGKATNKRSLPGKFRALIQLDGSYEKNGITEGLSPVRFEVEFNFSNRKLEPVRITKHPK